MKKLIFLAIAIVISAGAFGAGKARRAVEFATTVHKTDSVLIEKYGVVSKFKLKKVIQSGKNLDFYFDDNIGVYPFRKGDCNEIKKLMEEFLPEKYDKCRVNKIFCSGADLSSLELSPIENQGKAQPSRFRMSNHQDVILVDRGIRAPKGLEGKHLALWQSHGNYYNVKSGEWKWQRSNLFQTVEDLFTQSYVVPFLVPMLENAGANVFLPRERDFHDYEIIIDNDPCESGSGRIHGHIQTSGNWSNDLSGFADAQSYYFGLDNPFTMGTSLKCGCTSDVDRESRIEWWADIPSRDEYAVYVSYTSLPESCPSAEYTVHSFGSDKKVIVNQGLGGGEWIYIGTYMFDKGEQCTVSLSNISSRQGAVVTADAVKIGGGKGNIARGKVGTSEEYCIPSGRPRYAEGARYFLQWSGVPQDVWSQNEQKDDYRDDLMSRGMWVQHLCGGSWVNPEQQGLGIPIDLSLAFHTDAGISPSDSIIGTLAIYTRLCEKKATLPSGGSRDTARELCDFVQSQITEDLREKWDSQWTRRQIWNRSYSESRTTGVPAMLLELLSHQNFEDMKYGLDPAFRFDAARACYKGILKYMSMHYGYPYVVEPLPVAKFSARVLNDDSTLLQWEGVEDPLEPTASPTSYIVYTRIDDGGWDSGIEVSEPNLTTTQQKGHIYSYKIVAVNDGGVSFPSEVLAVGIPEDNMYRKVVVVNNFHRISGPTWNDSADLAGFDNDSDSGVPYIRDWAFVGRQRSFARTNGATSGSSEFGFSDLDFADKVIGGNTFDYPFIHGSSILKAGYAFQSCSADAFCSDMYKDCFAADIICGKECRVRTSNRSPVRGGVLSSPQFREELRSAAFNGCNIMISGCYIGTDIYGSVFPIEEKEREEEKGFVHDVLGYSLRRAFATRSGEVATVDGSCSTMHLPISPVYGSYCCESVDALSCYTLGSQVVMHYADTGLPAAVRKDFFKYKVAAFGFPLEILDDEKGRDSIFLSALKYFANH